MRRSHLHDPSEHENPGQLSRRTALRRIGQGGIVATTMTAAAVGSQRAFAHDEAVTTGTDELVVQSATHDALPDVSPETIGRLRRLSDYDRSLWLETDEQWLSLRGEIFDVRAYGALGDGTTDDWPAFNLAIESMTTALETDSTSPYGRTLYVPPGTYRCSQSLVISRAIRLVGASGMGPQTDSVIQVDRGIVGIIVAAADPGVTGQPGRRGDGTIIERLRIVSADPPETEGTPTASSKAASIEADPATVHGMWLQARAAVRDTCVEGFSGDGIHVEIGTGPTENPQLGAGVWEVSGCWVAGCGGHGLTVLGAGSGVAHLLNATDNAGWGIQDNSTTGATFLQCVASGNSDGPFTSTGPSNRSLFLECVAADDRTRAVFGASTVVVGGNYAGGFAGGNAWTADAARMTLQAQSPDEDRLPTVPTLHLRAAVGQTRAHLRISNRSTRLVEVDSAGRLLIGPADLAPAADGGDQVGVQPVQMQISHPESGQAALRWVVASEGGTGAWVAQVRAYQDAGGTDENPEGGTARLTFQTPGPGTSEVDTLTLTGDRVGIGTVAPSPAAVLELASAGAGFLPPRLTSEQRDAVANPPEGLTIYNLTSHRLNVHDGEQWREVAFT